MGAGGRGDDAIPLLMTGYPWVGRALNLYRAFFSVGGSFRRPADTPYKKICLHY